MMCDRGKWLVIAGMFVLIITLIAMYIGATAIPERDYAVGFMWASGILGGACIAILAWHA